MQVRPARRRRPTLLAKWRLWPMPFEAAMPAPTRSRVAIRVRSWALRELSPCTLALRRNTKFWRSAPGPRKHAREPGGADCLINGPTMRFIRLEPSPCLWTIAGRIAPTHVHAGGSTCRPAADSGPVYAPYLENVSDRCRLRQWTSNDLALSKSQNIGLAVAEARQHLVVMLTKLGCYANAGRSLRK